MSHSVDGTYGFYVENQQTARKQHDCCACEIPTEPGQRYWVIRAQWEGIVRSWKRCLRCQFLHVQLRELCRPDGDWPDENLNCGHTFEERWERTPPSWLAALAFWRAGDPLPHVYPCGKLNQYEYTGPVTACIGGSREWMCCSQSDLSWRTPHPTTPLPSMQLCGQVAS